MVHATHVGRNYLTTMSQINWGAWKCLAVMMKMMIWWAYCAQSVMEVFAMTMSDWAIEKVSESSDVYFGEKNEVRCEHCDVVIINHYVVSETLIRVDNSRSNYCGGYSSQTEEVDWEDKSIQCPQCNTTLDIMHILSDIIEHNLSIYNWCDSCGGLFFPEELTTENVYFSYCKDCYSVKEGRKI